jgi:hypothetical protein
VSHAHHYCEDVAHISRGSDTPTTDWWRLADAPQVRDDRGTGWFVHDDHPGVRARVTFLLDGTLVGFELVAEGVGITTRLVRAVPVGELVRAARSVLLAWAEQGAKHFRPPAADMAAADAKALRGETKRPGRAGHPEQWYAALAVAYEAWQTTRKPLELLAGEQGLSVGGLRAALHTARRKGFLTEAPPGRAGGMATDKATELVGKADG